MKNICVFCGASDNIDQIYITVADTCGKLIGKNQFNLIYGGGAKGMMGIVARAASLHGAKVTGIFPLEVEILDKNESLNKEMDETIFVSSMYERKQVMIERSDIFIILPGGLGTLDELFEVLTLKNLGTHNKEIIIVNINNYWTMLLTLINELISAKFVNSEVLNNYSVVKSIDEAFDKIQNKELQNKK